MSVAKNTLFAVFLSFAYSSTMAAAASAEQPSEKQYTVGIEIPNQTYAGKAVNRSI